MLLPPVLDARSHARCPPPPAKRKRNGVHQVVCKPDWNKHKRAAPFRRNEELLNLLPKGLIAFPGNGITDNLVDRARQLGIPVQRCDA